MWTKSKRHFMTNNITSTSVPRLRTIFLNYNTNTATFACTYFLSAYISPMQNHYFIFLNLWMDFVRIRTEETNTHSSSTSRMQAHVPRFRSVLYANISFTVLTAVIDCSNILNKDEKRETEIFVWHIIARDKENVFQVLALSISHRSVL